jgi:hypothetical protein
MKNKIGDAIAPIKRLFVLFSNINSIDDIAQHKKIRDSYKLLNGKYDCVIQRINNVRVNKRLLIITLILPILKLNLFLGIERLIQYAIIAIKRKKQAIIGN